MCSEKQTLVVPDKNKKQTKYTLTSINGKHLYLISPSIIQLILDFFFLFIDIKYWIIFLN